MGRIPVKPLSAEQLRLHGLSRFPQGNDGTAAGHYTGTRHSAPNVTTIGKILRGKSFTALSKI
jgi:hypothetical protein